MTKKQQFYYLLEAFFRGEYDIRGFCNAYEDIFYPEIPKDEFTDNELSKIQSLGKVVVRYSPFEDDIKTYAGVYYSEKDVEKAIRITCLELFNKETGNQGL